MSVESATWLVLQRFDRYLCDADDGPIIWLALGLLQLEHGRLQTMVRSHVINILSAGSALHRWEDAPPDNLAERQRVLGRLRTRFADAKTV